VRSIFSKTLFNFKF